MGTHSVSQIKLQKRLRRLTGEAIADFNMIASIGGFFFGAAQVYFFFAVVLPMLRGKGDKAPQRPWEGAEGLEWEVPSPAPFHTFEEPPKLDATATRVIG